MNAPTKAGTRWVQKPSGDEGRDDGYVYGPAGQRLRKWFIELRHPEGGAPLGVVWEPALHDLAAIEQRRWGIVSREGERASGGPWEAIKAAHVAHYLDRPDWVLTYKHYTDKFGTALGACTRDEIGGPLQNEALGLALTVSLRRMQQETRRRQKFEAAFMTAAEIRFGRYREKGHGGLLHATINGRHYWFKYAPNRSAVPILERLAFHEDIVAEYEI